MECLAEVGLVLYEVPTERHVVCLEERDRELLGPVYEEEDTSMEIDFLMASPEIGRLFSKPTWNVADMLNCLMKTQPCTSTTSVLRHRKPRGLRRNIEGRELLREGR